LLNNETLKSKKETGMDKAQRVVLVTGASSGIGKATSTLLAAKGWRVYAAARRIESMQDLTGKGAIPMKLDITDKLQCSAAVDEILRKEGRIDALVNNAGYGSYGALEEVPDEEARRQLDVNVFGLMGLTRLILPHMRAQRSGRIINISSIGGRMTTPMGGWYHATKFAVEALSDALRTEVKPFGIEVVVIQPGSISTAWSGIAKDSLLAVSGNGPYSEPARNMAIILETAGRRGKWPMTPASPDVIARVIEHALQTNRPKTRYATPFHAKLFLFFRWLLPDCAFDKMVMAQLSYLAKRGGGTAGQA
jgi:NAD(P)-dependent dehydrogenase (short-subunit alcohol dehydrogenase family)